MALVLVGRVVVKAAGSGVGMRRWSLVQRKEMDAATAKVFMGLGLVEKVGRMRAE